jgi:prolyl-tRNA synthetase
MYARMTRHFPATRREMKTGLMGSHSLLEQAGYIRNAGAAGVFSLLPLGWRVHQRICALIFDVMEKHGVLNLQLPILQAQDLWERTGRWNRYVATKTMFVTTEQHSNMRFGLSPTAEEVVTALAASEIQSWRDLPLILHQIGPKFRDELRPRMGLLRCREFSMSDAYSFDRDEAGMRASFELLRKIYRTIFEAVGLRECISVQADSGAIGGQGSAEFMAISDNGEDVLFTCSRCDYGANVEKAHGNYPPATEGGAPMPLTRVPTPNVRTVDELIGMFPDLDATRMVKTIIFTASEGAGTPRNVAVCIRGDLEVNLVKLTNALRAETLTPAVPTVVESVTGAAVGFAGPLDLERVDDLLFDQSVEGLTNFLCGVNTTDYHALNVNWGRDIAVPDHYIDLASVAEGHQCAACNEGNLRASRGIEVGHIFMLQTGYAEKLNARYVDERGAENVIWMGCYGIGTTRLMQAIVEQNSDEHGILWPARIAPYDVFILAVNMEDPVHVRVAENAAATLTEAGYAVMYDDRGGAAGPKFMDADLLGVPVRLTSGRRARDGMVEVRERGSAEKMDVAVEHLARVLREKGVHAQIKGANG